MNRLHLPGIPCRAYCTRLRARYVYGTGTHHLGRQQVRCELTPGGHPLEPDIRRPFRLVGFSAEINFNPPMPPVTGLLRKAVRNACSLQIVDWQGRTHADDLCKWWMREESQRQEASQFSRNPVILCGGSSISVKCDGATIADTAPALRVRNTEFLVQEYHALVVIWARGIEMSLAEAIEFGAGAAT